MTAEHRQELLASLLGPGEQEVSCEECFELLDEYVEVGLTGGDTRAALPGMDAHLEGCPACHEDMESLRALVSRQRPPAPGP